MLVTKIERQKKNPSRKSVYLDGTFAFGVTNDTLLQYSLHEGDELSAAEVETIIARESEQNARQKALRFLAMRPRTEKEIAQYLGKKGYDEKTASSVLSKLQELNLLDDEEFARMLCRDKLRRKPVGEPMLRQLLARKGVPRSITDNVLAEFFTHESEEVLALAAARTHHARLLHSSKKLDAMHMKKRIYEYLLRRGFSSESVHNAAKQIFIK